MPNTNEIKKRIEGVKNTKKITRAMYLISVSKSKKAKAQMNATRPYFAQINETLADIMTESEHIDSAFVEKKPGISGKTLYIVLAGDRGMAGAYNHNIIDLLEKSTDKMNSQYMVAGMMGRQQIIRKGFDVDLEFKYPVMNPTIYRAREIAELCVQMFMTEWYNEIYIVYTKMITPIKQDPKIIRLLPLAPELLQVENTRKHSSLKFMYEPDPVSVFNHLTPHYLKGVIYGAFVEAFTSEQHARTYAMDNATKSADDMVEKLTIIHNRARQAKITAEITEIIGGIPSE